MTWFNNLKTQLKLLIVFSIIILTAAGLVTWLVYNLLVINAEATRLMEKATLIADIETVQASLLKQQLAISTYCLTGDEAHLVEFTNTEEETLTFLRLASVEAQNPDEFDTLALITDELTTYNTAFEEVIALHEEGAIEEAMVLAEQISAEEEARALTIADQIERLVYRETLRIDAQLETINRQTRQVIAGGAAGMVALTALAVVSSLVTNEVTEPIRNLTNAIVAFENDTYHHRLLADYTSRREELGKMARSFESMVNSITAGAAAKDQLIAASSRFIPYAYLDFLNKESITDLRLGDHVSAEMAVMFSDIRSFTTLSEGMTPQQNFDFVNRYLSRVSPVIQDHGGFVVKFLGDGMMAVFPYNVDDAVQASIAKLEAVHAYNAQRTQPIEVGIGVHTGHMMVGMIGEEERMQGDAFSDNVNLTARIEGLNKFYRTNIIITAETIARLVNPREYALRTLGQAQVKGRDAPIRLFEVFAADPPAVRDLKHQTLDLYTEAHDLFAAGDFPAARDRFTQIVERNPQDAPARHFADRSIFYMQHDPAALNWQGVEVMTTK